MKNYKVAIVVGSLRKGSFNRRAAKALIDLAPENLDFNFVEIGDLPFFNEDLEASDTPDAWTQFRSDIGAADAVLFMTPEYNRSVPGVLKNAIDVGSRPYGASIWAKKPAAIMSVSVGAVGGFGANHHLRQSLTFLDMPVLQQPEAYVGGAYELFDENGKLANDDTRGFFQAFITAFSEWIDKTANT